MNADEPERIHPQVYIEPGQMAGVWANFARVGHSPYEFTLDFIRLDFSASPPEGIVVARVSLSPLMVTQLTDALRTNWESYAEKSMPPEVRQHGAAEQAQPDAQVRDEDADARTEDVAGD